MAGIITAFRVFDDARWPIIRCTVLWNVGVKKPHKQEMDFYDLRDISILAKQLQDNATELKERIKLADLELQP